MQKRCNDSAVLREVDVGRVSGASSARSKRISRQLQAGGDNRSSGEAEQNQKERDRISRSNSPLAYTGDGGGDAFHLQGGAALAGTVPGLPLPLDAVSTSGFEEVWRRVTAAAIGIRGAMAMSVSWRRRRRGGGVCRRGVVGRIHRRATTTCRTAPVLEVSGAGSATATATAAAAAAGEGSMVSDGPRRGPQGYKRPAPSVEVRRYVGRTGPTRVEGGRRCLGASRFVA